MFGSDGTRYEWVGAWSERRARLSPDATGLVDATTGDRYSYAELDARANRVARTLASRGVDDGGRVAVVSRNRPELVECFFAAGKTGGVLAPLSHRLAAPEIAALLDDVEPSLLVVEEPFDELAGDALRRAETDCSVLSLPTEGDHQWHAFSEALPADPSQFEARPRAMSDPHLLLHTGGSTGVPKETVLTHESILWNSFNTITAWGLRPDDVTPMVFPMFHTGGWNVLTIPFFHVGATVVVAREFDPEQVLRIVGDEAATVLVAVPTVLREMCRHEEWTDADLSSLRFAKSGGGPCRKAVMEAWWERDVELSQGYGLTECGPNNFTMPNGWSREKAASVGTPAMHVDAHIVDADGEPVESDEIGELELSSPHAAAGYWRNEEATAATFGEAATGESSGRRVSTGDLARVDEDGYYYIEGRKKNMYVSGGENVYPPEIEDAAAEHPKVEEIVIIGVPDETWGEVGKAVVQGDASLALDELRSFLDGKLARFKLPKRLEHVETMPTNGPSKIDRATIEERFGESE